MATREAPTPIKTKIKSASHPGRSGDSLMQSLERILTEFFPGTPDNMKIALLMRTVNTDKYRSILDSMKIPGMAMPTYLELKQAVLNHYATDRAEHEQKMKGAKRKAQQEENRTPKPKISPHAAMATAIAAEDTTADTASTDRSTSRTLNVSNAGSLDTTPTSARTPRKTEIRHRY